MIKGSIQEEYFTWVKIYTPNIGAPKYVKQTLTDIKREIHKNTIMIGDFNTQVPSTDWTFRQENSKATDLK